MSLAAKWLLLAVFFPSNLRTSFSTPCGGLLWTNTSSKSLGFPTAQNTGEKVSCDWVIRSPSSRRIRLTFTDFVLKTLCCSCRQDFLEIRDGANESAPLIGRFCAKRFPKIVYSTRESIWIRFESDFRTDINNRFRLSFEDICGRHMASWTGSFTSPNFPAKYDNNLDCIYSVEVPRGRIRVEFESFDVDGRMPVCLDDYLEVQETRGNVVYSERDQNRAAFRKFCGQENPGLIYSTLNSYLWFHFRSNSFRTRRGFKATYRTISVGEGSCGGTLEASQGYIYSQNYPFPFPPFKECQWKIQVPEGKYVHLFFSTFNFSRSVQNCRFGRLEVYDGLSLNFKIGRYCGSTLPGKVVSRTNEMSLRVVSSDVSQTGWFALKYIASSEGTCEKNKFTCHNRQCIDKSLYCNVDEDCADGSDELKCSVSGKTFSWYSFWPLSVVLVMVLMGLWLWRTWKKFVGPRSDIERSYSNCTSPCHHHHSNTCVSDVMEPPSYSEAVVLGDQPPPSYEEALAHRQSEEAANDTCNSSPSQMATTPVAAGNNSQVAIHADNGEQVVTYLTERNSIHDQQTCETQNSEAETRI